MAPMAARRAQPVQRSRSQGLRGNRDACRPRRGVVGPSYGSFAFGQARKLIPSAGPPLPTEPAAQPLAALPPYGCGVPLAGTSLGFGGGPVFTCVTGAAAPRAARIAVTPQALRAAALYRLRPPGRHRCHAPEIPRRSPRVCVGLGEPVRLPGPLSLPCSVGRGLAPAACPPGIPWGRTCPVRHP